jgi:hypothetical protein
MLQGQANTTITGTVSDAETGEPLAFVAVTSGDTAAHPVAAATDAQGRYRIVTATPPETIRFEMVGYEPAVRKVGRGATQSVNVDLTYSRVHLDEIVITNQRTKYRRKGNPAVDLIRKAIERKAENRMKKFDSYRFRKHEKILFAIANIPDSAQKTRLFKTVPFLFESTDTSRITGKRYLPFYMGETLSEHYYRRQPEAAKTCITAQRNVEVSKFLETESMDVVIRRVFGEVDIYDNTVYLLGNRFVSPLSPWAAGFYQFFIADTVDVSGTPCYELYFTPQNAMDFGFRGKLFLTADSAYAVKRVALRLTPATQVNFVTDLLIEQEFAKRDSAWFPERDITTVEFSLAGKTFLSFHGKRVNTFGDAAFNIPQPDSLYGGLSPVVHAAQFDARDERYWAAHRLDSLTGREAKIYTSYRQLETVKRYTLTRDLLLALAEGYVAAGCIDVGPVENAVSFNSVEGVRLRAGGKTNGKFHRHLFLEGFLAYGTRDRAWKYNASVMYSFNRKKNHPWEFPVNLLTVACEYNTQIPGQGYLYGTADRLFVSIGRGRTEKMTFDRKFEISYRKENNSHFGYTLTFSRTEQRPLAELQFTAADGRDCAPYTTTSLGVDLRLSPGERFFQWQRNRYPLNPEAAVYTLRYSAAFAGLWGGARTFHRLEAGFAKRWYLAGYGYLDMSLDAGKIFNRVPFPSLFVAHANQGFAFQEESFNTMRYFEFVSDRYASLKLAYALNGFLFNRIPVVKKLRWRELITFKALYGAVGDRNIPGDGNGLMRFPHDADGRPTTFAPGRQPFMEAGFGIDNIFSFLRIDVIKRLNYLDHPAVREWTVKAELRFAF